MSSDDDSCGIVLIEPSELAKEVLSEIPYTSQPGTYTAFTKYGYNWLIRYKSDHTEVYASHHTSQHYGDIILDDVSPATDLVYIE